MQAFKVPSAEAPSRPPLFPMCNCSKQFCRSFVSVRVTQMDNTCKAKFYRACKMSQTSVLSRFTCAEFITCRLPPFCCHCRQRRSVAGFNCRSTTSIHDRCIVEPFCPLRLNACLAKCNGPPHAPPGKPMLDAVFFTGGSPWASQLNVFFSNNAHTYG